MAAEKQALGRRRAGLEVWQRKRGVLGSSAYPRLELDQPSPCAPSDVPITSPGARHRDGACQMCWHEDIVRDLLLIPYLLLLRMTQLLPQEPEQADSCGVQSPAKPRPVPSGPSKKHPHGQGFSVEMGDTGRQGFLAAWSPSKADRAHYKGWRVCSSLGTPYPLIQAATGRGRSLASVQGVKSSCSLQHYVKVWVGGLGMGRAGQQVEASLPTLSTT